MPGQIHGGTHPLQANDSVLLGNDRKNAKAQIIVTTGGDDKTVRKGVPENLSLRR